MLFAVALSVVDAQPIDVVEEPAESVFEHPRHVGAPETAALHHVLHGEVGVDEELLGFYGAAYGALDGFDGLLRRRSAGGGWFVVVKDRHGADVVQCALWMEHHDEQCYVEHGEQQMDDGHAHLRVAHHYGPNEQQVEGGDEEHSVGKLHWEILFVGVVVVNHVAHPFPDPLHGGQCEEQRGNAFCQEDVKDDLPCRRRDLWGMGNNGHDEQRQDGEGNGYAQDDAFAAPPVPLFHRAEIFVDENAADVWHVHDEIGFRQQPCCRAAGPEHVGHEQEGGGEEEGRFAPAGIVVVLVFVVGTAKMKSSQDCKKQSREDIGELSEAQKVFVGCQHRACMLLGGENGYV